MISVSFRGTNYNVPEPSDTFPQSLTDYLNAISTGAVPFPTTADIDLGASGFGLKLAYAKTRAANPSASGLLRLATGDTVAWRNAGNTADLALAVDAQNQLTFGGVEISGNPFMSANTSAGQSIVNATTPIIVYGTVETDTDSAYNASTGRYTVPAGKGGHYDVSASCMYVLAQTGVTAIHIFKNAAAFRTAQYASPGATQSLFIEGRLVLAPGDIIDIRTAHPAGSPQSLQAGSGNLFNFFSLKRITT